ncbi:MAG TPA: precorrin-2 C(20)-methyltransferase [Deltaproteobacteria bacterium]|nr:precorrin-2 C(20)-methyltransferase [Deltaproteobacteria bacterium]
MSAVAATLYGVGVGPGRPELLTLEAVRVVGRAPVVAVPATGAEGAGLALSVVESVVDLSEKEIMELAFPMTRDEAVRRGARRAAAGRIASRLREPSDVAFLTLGDPLFYSTFGYMAALVREMAPETEVKVVPGVTSISACAAAAGAVLVEGRESMAVIADPRDTEGLKEALERFDTVAVMKLKGAAREVALVIEEAGLAESAVFVERAGWPGERVLRDVGALAEGDEADYFSIVIVKRSGF